MAKNQDFYSRAFGYAKDAGFSDAQAHLAASQASLETGFGRSVKGNNYFGVKAGSSWAGPTQNLRTWEEVGGKRQNITDKFRSYANPIDSFKDWAKTVGNRWSGALSAPTFSDAVSSLRAGQPGGYATDSQYGSKLHNINRNYGTDVGIMAAIEKVPTPTQRPYSAPLTSVESAALSAPQGKAMPTFDQGRFGNPTFDTSRFGAATPQLTGKQQLQRGLLDQQLDYGILPSIQYEQTPVAAAYADPAVATAQSPAAAQALGAMGGGGGLLGAPAISDRQYEIAAQTTKDLRNRGLLGGFGGALLGGALLGPVGGLVGGYLGRSAAQKSYFPEAPEKLDKSSKDSRGYGGLNERGRDAYNESKQFKDAVDRGSSGLW